MELANKIREDFLSECATDSVGLWSLIWNIKHVAGVSDSEEIRKLALAILLGLLISGRIRAGVPTEEHGFEQWQLSPEQIIRAIKQQWDDLGREPDIGEIVWFTSAENTTNVRN
ncbi:MAG: hypothetical protein QOH41_761 [Blastocatellia bacterium]|jgi:hypothetical protein|nr:hypothetical protein [Blastocatellia bacterium]